MELRVFRKATDCGVALVTVLALKPRRLVVIVIVVVIVKFFQLTFVFVSVVGGR